MFFAHWSSTDSSYRDMERRNLHCERCCESENDTTQHTFRYHITKTKHYSAISIGAGEKTLTLICHGCLLESNTNKYESENLMRGYDMEITVIESFELMDGENYKKAEKKLRKLLKKNPEYSQGVFAITKCLIMQKKYDEAEFYLKDLETNFTENQEIKELRKLMIG